MLYKHLSPPHSCFARSWKSGGESSERQIGDNIGHWSNGEKDFPSLFAICIFLIYRHIYNVIRMKGEIK